MVRHSLAQHSPGTDHGRPQNRHSAAARAGGAPRRRVRRGQASGRRTWPTWSAPPATTPSLAAATFNLYSLFVERAMALVKPDGFVGLLTPSGIYGDMTAAKFFKSVSTSGRLSSLFDFENRRRDLGLPHFFPDVDSRFKFCVLSVRRRPAHVRPDRRAPSSSTIRRPSTTPTAASPSLPPTSPASTPTPARPPSSALAGTPKSPAASTKAILSS